MKREVEGKKKGIKKHKGESRSEKRGKKPAGRRIMSYWCPPCPTKYKKRTEKRTGTAHWGHFVARKDGKRQKN